MFSDKELMQAYGYALGSDHLEDVMVGHLAMMLPWGITLDAELYALIRKQVARFLA